MAVTETTQTANNKRRHLSSRMKRRDEEEGGGGGGRGGKGEGGNNLKTHGERNYAKEVGKQENSCTFIGFKHWRGWLSE